MDNCCLNRPFDDQSNMRIHLEAEAIKAIIILCEQGLGVANFIRFMQQFDSGEGNYTEDRQSWQKDYTVDRIIQEINVNKEQSAPSP